MTERSPEQEALGRALGKLPSGVFVATCGTGAHVLPFVASWVQQAAFEPPCLTIAIQAERPALAALERSEGHFTLSILPEGRSELMKPFFGTPAPEDPFGGLETAPDPHGSRYLADALAWLSCRATSRMQVGDHVVIGAEILAGGLLDEQSSPMVHLRKTGYSY